MAFNNPLTPVAPGANFASTKPRISEVLLNTGGVDLFGFSSAKARKLAQKREFLVLKHQIGGKKNNKSTSKVSGVMRAFGLNPIVNGKNMESTRGPGISYIPGVPFRWLILSIIRNFNFSVSNGQSTGRVAAHDPAGNPLYYEFTPEGIQEIFGQASQVVFGYLQNGIPNQVSTDLGISDVFLFGGPLMEIRVSGKMNDLVSFLSQLPQLANLGFAAGDISTGRVAPIKDYILNLFTYNVNSLDLRNPNVTSAMIMFFNDYNEQKKTPSKAQKQQVQLPRPDLLLYMVHDVGAYRITNKDGSEVAIGATGKVTRNIHERFIKLLEEVRNAPGTTINITGYADKGTIKTHAPKSGAKQQGRDRKVHVPGFRFMYQNRSYIVDNGVVVVGNKRTRAQRGKNTEIAGSAVDAIKQLLADLGLANDSQSQTVIGGVVAGISQLPAAGQGKVKQERSAQFFGEGGYTFSQEYFAGTAGNPTNCPYPTQEINTLMNTANQVTGAGIQTYQTTTTGTHWQ